jgi:hypothetical protein
MDKKLRHLVAACALVVLVVVGVGAGSVFRKNFNDELARSGLSIGAPTFTGDMTLENGEIISNSTDAVISKTFDDDAAELGDEQVKTSITAGEDANYFRKSWWFYDDGGVLSEMAYMDVSMDDETSNTTDATIQFGVVTNDTLADEMELTGSALTPAADGGLDLGTAGKSFGAIVADGAVDFNSTANIQGALTLQAGLVRTGQEYIINSGGRPGATNGWLTTGSANLMNYTLPASETTTATLVIPVSGLHVGDTITAWKLVGQIESAGNTVEMDGDLRKITTVEAGNSDASVGAITPIDVTADTAVAAAKTGLTEVVAANESFYVLVSATTASSTDIDLQGITVTVTGN